METVGSSLLLPNCLINYEKVHMYSCRSVLFCHRLLLLMRLLLTKQQLLHRPSRTTVRATWLKLSLR